MHCSVQLRRSQRLKNVQPDKNCTSLEKNNPSRKCGRPRNLILKEQALPDIKPTESVSACSSLNQEKYMAFCSKRGRQRKLIPQGGRHCNELKCGHANVNNLVGGTGEQSNIVKQDLNVIAGPVNDPIWIGSIYVRCENFSTVDGLAAHISSKAGAKVCELAERLPPLLHFEMLSRLDVWPTSFDTFPPTDDIIDLYILPEDRRNEGVFDRLLNDMTGKDIVLKAVLDDVSVLVFTSLQLTYKYWKCSKQNNGKLGTSERYYLWAVFAGKNAFFPHQLEEHNSIHNFDCTMPLNLANEVCPVTGCERNVSTNLDTEQEDKKTLDEEETWKLALEKHSSIFLSESPCTLVAKEFEEQQAGRAVGEGLAEEGNCGIIADSIRQEIDAIKRTCMDKHPEIASKEVIGEETLRKGVIDACAFLSAIPKSLRPNVVETITPTGFLEFQPNYAESRCRLDQSAVEGIVASCSPHMADTLNELCRDKSDVPGASSLTHFQEFVRNPALQSCSEEQGAYSPDRLSNQSIGTSILGMASTFDDLTDTDEISSADNYNENAGHYSVNPRYAQVLHAIMDKHGDIARDYPIKCSKMLTFALERVCEAVHNLENVRFVSLRRSHLQSLHSTIIDAELVKLDVKWLRNRYEELVEAVDQIKEYKNLKVSRKKMKKTTESKKKAIAMKKTQMLKLQSEIETLESEVTQTEAKSESISSAINNVTSKCKHFRHNSLMDGLF